MSCRHPTLQRLYSLSPWLGQWYPQIMAPLLPIGSRKACAIGFGSTAVSSPVWGANVSPIINREEDRALALGGCQSINILNNQLLVGGSGRGDVRAEARQGGGVMGGHRPIVWGGESNDKKVDNVKYIMALDGCWVIILHTTTNQKQTPVTREST
jgi:hypothetical protein